MRITNKQFVAEYLLSYPADEVIALLSVVHTLISRHEMEKVLQIAADKRSPETAQIVDVITALRKVGKCTLRGVNALINSFKTMSHSYTREYILRTSDAHSSASLHKRLGESTSHSLELDTSASSEP